MRGAPESPEDAEVKLKALLGVPPTTYLPILYAVLLLVIVFLLLFLPGIVNPGTRFVVISNPSNAAVSVDGVVIGRSGDAVFVPAGERNLVVSRPGFEPYRERRSVRGRLFFSLFVPRRETLRVSLDAVRPQALVAAAANEFANWSFIGEASGQYQFPPVARDLGSDLAAVGRGNLWDDFLVEALMHANSEAQLADLVAGSALARSGGSAASPLSMIESLTDLAELSSDRPGVTLQFDEIVGGIRGETLGESAWIEAGLDQFIAAVNGQEVVVAPGPGSTRDLAGIRFVSVPAGAGRVGGSARAERGGSVPYTVSTDGFLVSQTEITVAQYRGFVETQPQWALENRDQLVSEGLADDEYLRDWEDRVPAGDMPVVNVSAHAAEAFAAWFSTQVNGVTARLPTEAEWDYLAALDGANSGVFATSSASGPQPVGQSTRGQLGLYGVLGNAWEWTADGFATNARYHRAPGVAGVPVNTPHRVVRGGGWATPLNDFTPDDRGSIPDFWCSGAVGFRLVVVEE